MARWKRPQQNHTLTGTVSTNTASRLTLENLRSMWNAVTDSQPLPQIVNEAIEARRRTQRHVLDTLHFQGSVMLFPYIDEHGHTRMVRLPAEAIIDGLQWDE